MKTTIVVERGTSAIARIVFQSETGIQILSMEVLKELRSIIKALKRDPALRVIVFEARGRTFTAGANLHELRALTSRSARRYSRFGQRLFQMISELSAITISAIHAPCAGGGLELSLACDLRLAATEATIGFPEVRLGVIPGWGGTVRSHLLLGPAVARRIILSGELLAAVEAQRLGLVDAVYPDADFRTAVDERIAQLLRAAPSAAARVKNLIGCMELADLYDMLDMEANEFAACYKSDEPPEGIAAFLEKRPARWVHDAQ